MCNNHDSIVDLLSSRELKLKKGTLLHSIRQISRAAKSSDDGDRCMIAPHPDLREQIKKDLAQLRSRKGALAAANLYNAQPLAVGLNDGLIIPPDEYPLGTALSVMRSAAADRAPLRGTLRVIVVLVDFSDKAMAQNAAHFQNLFFSSGGPAKSVRDYYLEVTQGLIDIQGQVVGPFRMPQTLATYAHGASGLGTTSPNAQTMARDALAAANPSVNFAPFDNDGNGFVDAFIVIHAGSGAEQTGNTGDIWSHKWTIEGGAQSVDGTKVFGYLTVPEDSQIGVCCHELGHLLFGFPDLYDTDGSSEGIGNFCLMAAGSWGGNPAGSVPVHPSAWCKANQGWVAVNAHTSNGLTNIADVKDASPTVHRLWKDGAAGSEYFLVENRQQKGFDASLPGPGLLIWHIDETISGNTNENHPKVALLQADGKRDLEQNVNRGDAGDPYPGTAHNTALTDSSTPNSKSYAGISTCVAVTAIGAPADVMPVNLQVKCHKFIKEVKEIEKKDIKEHKELKDFKDIEKKDIKEHKDHKDFKEIEKKDIKEHKDIKEGKEHKEKEVKEIKDIKDGKELEKPVPDKNVEGPGGGLNNGGDVVGQLEARVAMLEQIVHAGSTPPQAFIGSELRPDLTQSALSSDDGSESLRSGMRSGTAGAKRHYDCPPTIR